MTASLSEIVAQLETGADLKEIAASLVPLERRASLERSSAARVFDKAMFNAVLKPASTEQSPILEFEALIAGSEVEPVPNTEGGYRIAPHVRQHYLRNWAKTPEEMKKVSRDLASFLEKERPENTLELLYQLTLSDPARAKDLFGRLFDEADARFDLVRCTNLIAVLEERDRDGLLDDSSLIALLLDARTYLGARTLHAADFYQTVHYLERKSLEKEFENLLAGSKHWVLQLHAAGGMGKTMFERWLVARHCIPKPHRIPCARIDFDVVNPVAGMREPWLLLLEIADQLNGQILRQPFYELIARYDPHRAMLRERGSKQTPATSEESKDLRETIPARFEEILRELPGSGPVLIIFDTLEEVILDRDTEPPKNIDVHEGARADRRSRLITVLDMMQRLYEQSEGRIRLILAGRYDLGERLTNLNATFGRGMKTVQLNPFTQKEAFSYLTKNRQLPDSPAIKAVIEKAEGNPFKLALYADLLRAQPEITEDEIRAYPDADIAYLINRIIARIIFPQVRWVLRYGVIPRHFTREFVEDVMQSPLIEAMTGRAQDDDPLKDPVAEKDRKTLFPTDQLQPNQSIDITLLWSQLGEHAAQYAWVSVPPNEPDTLVFHNDVVIPMRTMLGKYQPRIFKRLQQLAFEHFRGRAETDPARWSGWMIEALHHRAQFDADGFADFCRQVLAEAEEKGDAQGLLDVAQAIVIAPGPLPAHDRQEARWTLARAAIESARLSNNEALWQSADQAVQQARIGGEEGGSREWSAREAIAITELAAHFGRWEEAEHFLGVGASLAPTRQDRFSLLVPRGEILVAVGRWDEAKATLEEAWSARQELPAAMALRAANGLLRVYWHSLALDQLVVRCGEALTDLDLSTGEKVPVMFTLIHGLLGIGQFTAAKEFVGRARMEISEWPAAISVLWSLEAQAWLRLEDPLQARECAARAIQTIERLGRTEVTTAEQELLPATALAWSMMGEAEAALFQFKPALDGFERARSLYERVPDPTGANSVQARLISLLLDDVGNLREAGSLLQRAEHGPRSVEITTLRARLQDRRGLRASGAELIRTLSQSSLSSPDRIKELVAAIAFGDDRISELLAVLTPLPPATRVVFLSDAVREWPEARGDSGQIAALLREFNPWSQPSEEKEKTNVYRTLTTLFVPPPSSEKQPQSDLASLSLRLTEVLHFAGDRRNAKRCLEGAVSAWTTTENHTALRKCAAAGYDLLGLSGEPREEVPDTAPWVELPGFMTALLIDRARWRQRAGDTDGAVRLCNHALAYAERIPMISRLHADVLARLANISRALGETENAASVGAQAAELYLNLGDSAAADRLQKRATMVDEGDPFIRISFDRETGRIEVESRITRDAGIRQRERIVGGELLDQMRSSNAVSVIPEAFTRRLVEDWREAARTLTKLLLEPEDRVALRKLASSSPGYSVRLEIRDPSLSALPWEFLADQSVWLAVLDVGLRELLTISPDACLIHRTRGQRLDAAWRPRRAALILTPGEQRLLGHGRHSSSVRSKLAALYHSAEIQAATLEDPTFGQVQETIRKMRPATLHLCATMKESPTLGGAYLDFAREARLGEIHESLTDSGMFTASTLKRILEELPPQQRPLVIFDIAQPAGLSETVRQLMLRNCMAAEVFFQGAIPAVIATGLAPTGQSIGLSEVLIRGLGAGHSLGMVVQAMRDLATSNQEPWTRSTRFARLGLGLAELVRSGSGPRWVNVELDEILAPASVALFAEDPALRLVSPPS